MPSSSLTRAATPENEAELLQFAKASSAAGLERLVRGWKTMDRADEQRAERVRHGMRCLSVFPNNEGMYVVKGVLTPETAAVLMRAIDAAGDALFAASAKDDGERPDPAQLRADSLALVGQHGVYCRSERFPGRPKMDIALILEQLDDAKQLVQSAMQQLKSK